jgi:hypothetical protein
MKKWDTFIHVCCDTYTAELKHKPLAITQLFIRFYCLLHVSTFGKPSPGNKIYTQRKIILTQPIKMIIFQTAEISTFSSLPHPI